MRDVDGVLPVHGTGRTGEEADDGTAGRRVEGHGIRASVSARYPPGGAGPRRQSPRDAPQDVLTGQGVAGADEAGPGACVPWRGPWPGGGVRAER